MKVILKKHKDWYGTRNRKEYFFKFFEPKPLKHFFNTFF